MHIIVSQNAREASDYMLAPQQMNVILKEDDHIVKCKTCAYIRLRLQDIEDYCSPFGSL
jgi:hypothetical protein